MELLGSDMPDLQEDALRVLLSALRNDAHSCDNFIKQGVILGVVAVRIPMHGVHIWLECRTCQHQQKCDQTPYKSPTCTHTHRC